MKRVNSDMPDWLKDCVKLLENDRPFVLVSVAIAHGSAPRGPGAGMLVTADGSFGTIGGGNLEFTAIADARRILSSGKRADVRAYPLGPALDQCCGGHVTLLFTLFTPDDKDSLIKIRSDAQWQLVAELGDSPAHEFICADAGDDKDSSGDCVTLFDHEGRRCSGLRVDVADIGKVAMALHSPHTPLYIFGAGHVGRAVADIVCHLPLDVLWIDSRAEQFPPDHGDNIRVFVTDDPVSVVNDAADNALYLVFTHSHPLDFDITAAILARGDALYCGLIGSETKRARFIRRFYDEAGLDEERIARLTCPIGLGGPPGKEPYVIALGVVSELLTIVRSGPDSAF